MVDRRRIPRIGIGLLIVAHFAHFVRFATANAQGPDSSFAAIGRLAAMVSDTSIRSSIVGLQSFGTRFWNEPNRTTVAAWLTGRFNGHGLTGTTADTFSQSGTLQQNVVATMTGTVDPGREIVIGAHTDSYSYIPGSAPGADDNASGVAAVVEIARVLAASGYRPAATLRFIGFAAEEIGLRGSRSYASRARLAGRNIVAMLNFDMIAHHNRAQAPDQFNLVWYAGAEWLARLDSTMAEAYSHLTPVLTTTARSGSDSYAFYEQGYPAIFHYERGSNAGYHSPQDVIDSLDMTYAAGIVRSGLATLLMLDARIVNVVPPDPLPSSFALHPNFPNPFNSGTTVAYDLPLPGNVRLEVFDVLGRRVALLAEGFHPPATHRVRWDPVGISTGVYLLRMEWSGGAALRRMLLIR